MRGVASHRRLPARTLVLYLGVPLLACLAWALWHYGHGRSGADADLAHASELSGIPNVKASELKLALLADYYEHLQEHVPPQQDGAVMQRREWFYTPPRDPFEMLHSNLQHTANDDALGQRLATLEHSWVAGDDESIAQPADLEASLKQSSLSADLVLEAGRAFAFLAGNHLAATFLHAGLDKALVQYKSVQGGDPAALPLLHQLDQTKALATDWPALEKRFALAKALYPPLSFESRRAGCLYADVLFQEAKTLQAADAIAETYQQDQQAGMDPKDRTEMDWRAERYLTVAHRYAQAIPFCQDLLNSTDSRRLVGARYWVICLRALGQDAQADALVKRYGLSVPRPTAPPTTRSSAAVWGTGKPSLPQRADASRSSAPLQALTTTN